jgi:hypothetical protein
LKTYEEEEEPEEPDEEFEPEDEVEDLGLRGRVQRLEGIMLL